MSPAVSAAPRSGAGRIDRRYPVDQAASVSSAAFPGLVWTARVCDVSRRGLQLILERPAYFDPAVRIQWSGREVCGTVRYQHQRDGEYRVGVELAKPCESLVIDMLGRESGNLRQSNLELERQAAALREVSQIKSRFLASVSHEFRTPLNGIIGFSELLYDAVVGPVTSDQKDCLSDILGCSRHLLTLINQVLDLTKIESGKMDFQYEEVQLESVAREVLEGVKAIAAEKRVAIRIECTGPMGTVQADAARLRQVLYNYLSNALKATPAGGTVVVRLGLEEQASYRIEVEDTGAGISAENLSRLFTEFGQLGVARKPDSGTGLGLAITRQIVEAQGGRVGVESTVGVGSRFWALLPSHPRG